MMVEWGWNCGGIVVELWCNSVGLMVRSTGDMWYN